MTSPPMVPAGWYPDPAGQHEYRFWDGMTWTVHVSDGGVPAVDPLPPPPGARAGLASQHSGAAQATGAAQPADGPRAADGLQPADGPRAAGAAQASGEASGTDEAQVPEGIQASDGTQAAGELREAGRTQAAGELRVAGGTQAAGAALTSGGMITSGEAQAAAVPPNASLPVAAEPATTPVAGSAATPAAGLAGAAVPAVPALPGAIVTAPDGTRRRRAPWGLLVAALAVVAALIIGLVIWAPWQSPPLLRPTGLKAGPSTTSSVAFHWSAPATGPLPDKYLILRDGKVIGTVPGTVTSYRTTGLAPDSPYQYRIAAERGGKRSALSKVVSLRTAIPPLSAARLQGPLTVRIKITSGAAALHGPGPRHWTETWLATPKCPAGPCAVRLSAAINGHSFKATLTPSGADYTGTGKANVFPCGLGANSFPIKSTLRIKLTLTGAQVDNGAWTASAWSGRMVVTSPYAASGNFYCNSSRIVTSLSGGS